MNHSRFLILEGCPVPNLASRVMKLCLQRLPQDGTERYGHAVRVAVSAGEDRRRVRHRTSALNLAMLRRAALSVAIP